MKILHVTAAYKPAVIYGGPTMSVAMLCEELTKAGISVNVFTTTANGLSELPVNTSTTTVVDGVTVNYFKRITKDHTHFSPALLKALWREVKNYDAVHIHAWWNLVSVFSCIIALKKGIPLIVSPRGMLSTYSFNNKNIGVKNLIHRFLGESLLRKSHIHTTSVNEADAVAKLTKPLSITTIANFVKLHEAGHRPAIAVSDHFRLLFFSRIEEKKGLDILLNALSLVTAPYHLTIAGDGDPAYISHLKKLATANGINSNITWAGFFNDDKFDLFAQHHLMVLPSHDENFGNVVIESLSVGTAVLVSEHVGLADYISQKQLGWICQTTMASVSQAIDEVWNYHQSNLANIRAVAPQIVRNDFTGNSLTQQYINFYKASIT